MLLLINPPIKRPTRHRLIDWRIADDIPIFESIDGGAYQPADIHSLESTKEGTIVTIRKIEDVILDVKIGVAK